MNTKSFHKNYDVKSKTSHKETLKAQDLDIKREFLVLPTGKGCFESEKSYKNSYDLKGEKDSFYKKQERLEVASKAQNERSIEEATLLSAKEPASRAIFNQIPKEETEIREGDHFSHTDLNITYSYDEQQLETSKTSSSSLRTHLFALESKINSFESLQDLDLSGCLLGKQGIKALCGNSNLSCLKSLILTENPISNDGLKFISETSNWPKLQTLILCHIQIDYDGVKWLAMNENWISLKELNLSENPLIGDLGVISLCLNRTWTSLKTLGLWSCNVGTLGAIASRRHRNYMVLFAKDKTIIEDQNENFSFKKNSFRTTRDTQIPEKSLPTYPLSCSNRRLQTFESRIRGGSPQGDGRNDSSDIDYLGLLTKFQQHKEKILNDASLEKELKLFIEVQASTIPANHHGTNNGNSSDVNQYLELSFDLKRHLLNCEGSEASKILLLTGQAGSGKSLFCKNLQRELLSDWSQQSESEDRNWFPIYVELSSLNNPKSEAISETLSRELSLTNEEILFLKTSEQSNPYLPRLLFIFDGYDTIEDIHAFHSLRSRRDFFINHNFFVLNKIDGASWKNAKFVVTCREENLQKVQRRDLLFAPINTESSELFVSPRSLLQRKIDPFSNEQITCYLKKHYYYESKDINEEGPSWHHVKVFEKMIDDYQLREIARIPFMLWIIYQILPKLVTNGSEQINEMKSTYPQSLRKGLLIESFVNEVIQSMAKESADAFNSAASKEESKNAHREQDQHQAALQMKEIRQQAQTFALKSRGYIINKSADERSQHDDPSVLKIHPLVTWNNSNFQVRFDHPLLLEFLVAKSIEEEISQIMPSTKNEWLKIKKDLLINQRLLTSEASDVAVTYFLIYAIKEKRLKPDQFINLIYLSREKRLVSQENNGECIKEEHANSQSPFTVAAVNAITILNAAAYDFSHQDLTNIDIPSANLSFGKFEGINFMNANLAGVDFTGAKLKRANFVNSNMESVEFGEIPSLTLDNQKIKNIAYSPDGEYFAVDVGAKTVIFEVVDMQRNHFKEIRRFTGRFLNWGKQSRTQIITIEGEATFMEREQLEKVDERENGYEYEDDTGYGYSGYFRFGNRNSYEGPNVRFCTWDVISGESVQNLNLRIGNKRILSFNSERKEILTLNNKEVQKYDITSNSWIKFPIRISNGVKNYHLVAKNTKMLLLGDYLRKIILCNSNTGKPILKQRQRATSCKLSTDGQKIVATKSCGVIHISDVVRGCIIKSLITGSKNKKPEAFCSCSFNVDGKQILVSIRNKLTLQDIADSQLASLSLNSIEPDSYVYCLHPDGQQVAVVEEMHVVSLKKFFAVADLSIQTPTIRVTNIERLNLQGVIANSSFKLSEENIALLQKRGDYGIFNESMIKKLFSNSSADSKDVREVVLTGEKLAPIHAKIIGSDLLWIHLQRLDLSRNEIADIGAEAIGKNKLWMNLEILDLSQNKIKAEGALSIGSNKVWKKLVTLDLSSNQISDKQILIFLCSNKTWEHLQSLLLLGNPAILEASDVFKILKGIGSESLKMLVLPQAKFDQALLQCLRYSAPEDAVDLSLAKNGYNDIDAETIAANTAWTNLKKLDLKNNLISDEGGINIGSNTSWINLEELDLSGNTLEAQTAVSIGYNTAWSKLRVLNLNGDKIGSEGSYAIGNNKTWTELQTLELQDNLIGSKGIVALCQNQTWIKLQTLNLEKNYVDVEGAADLARNIFWVNLQTLNLYKNSIGADGAAELASNASWINLKTLDLGDNLIGDKGAAGLARNVSWINLQTLDLRSNLIRAEGAADLARNTSWINLHTLDLRSNLIYAEGAGGLARNISWINLQTLNLDNNSIVAEGAAELAKNTSWTRLQTLHLTNNLIDAEGAAELAWNISWINLQTLNLDNNSIVAEGAAELAKNTSWTKLQTLHLTNNLIDAEGAADLARNTPWINLQTLDLGNNSIGDKGATGLARNTSWINLQTLDLGNNSIGDKGAIGLARNTSWINLKTLDLGNNSIGDKGAAELARNICWINLQTLNLYYNLIGDKGAAELARNASWINLQTLNLYNNSIGAEGSAELAKNTIWPKTLKIGH